MLESQALQGPESKTRRLFLFFFFSPVDGLELKAKSHIEGKLE